MANPSADTAKDNVLRSDIYDDVYFSVEDGLAETRHVFLDSNDLPAAWNGKKRFNICETGFGTGLNFFAAWDLFEKTAAPDAVLHFISFEELVFAQMARLSTDGASYATFTAAGDVRRGLAAAGFSVEKISGFGRKREMIRGRYIGLNDKEQGA